MAKVCLIVGESGDGKTTSFIVPPDGNCSEDYVNNFPKNYKGVDPKTTMIFNCDGKELPFPYKKLGWEEGKTLFTSKYENSITAEYLTGDPVKKTKGMLDRINEGKNIKIVIIDTLNGSMNDKEMAGGLSWD